MLHIQRAEPADTPRVIAFYDDVIDAMHGATYKPGWQKDVYPTRADLADAVSAGTVYAGILDGAIAASMVVNGAHNPGYENIAWQVNATPAQLRVIHLLAVHPNHAGKGFGKQMVRHALTLARQAGCLAVRLDVLKGNNPANRLYESTGFSYKGTVQLFYEDTGWTDFLMYEHVL